jgi:hypothetical protein
MAGYSGTLVDRYGYNANIYESWTTGGIIGRCSWSWMA